MTMDDDLFLTAEQSYVGALLARPALAAELPALRVTDFTDPQCQAIYQAIVHTLATSPQAAADPAQLTRHVAGTVQHAAADQAALDRYTAASSSTSAAEAASYARMITEAAIQRDLPGHAERIAVASSPRPELADWLLAATAAARTVTQAAAQDPPPASREQEAREITVLAGLLRHRGEAAQVTSWLPPGALSTGIRREIYQAITSLSEHGDPVTPFTVTWQLAGRRDPAITGTRAWDDISTYLQLHLAPADPQPGDATLAGRELLTAHITARLGQYGLQPGPGPQPALAVTREHHQELLQPPPPLQPGPSPQPRI
jgi:replicative DNA helicase